MKKIFLILSLFLLTTICCGQSYKTYRVLILPKDIQIERFCNNRFIGNYYIGNYWTNLNVLIKVKEPKPYKIKKEFQLNLKNDKYKFRFGLN